MPSVIRGGDNLDSAKVAGKGLPVNQTASRAINTDYTNNSGGTRTVYVYGNNGTANCVVEVSYNAGVTWMVFGGSAIPSGVAIGVGMFLVPDGATYRVRSASGTFTITQWWEQ